MMLVHEIYILYSNCRMKRILFQSALINIIYIYIIQLSLEGEVNSGGYIPRREAARYIFTP